MGANRRRALIGRLVITNRCGAVTTGVFPRIADAAKAAATAPIASECMTGIGNSGEHSRARGSVTRSG